MKTPLLIVTIAAGLTMAATAEARDGRGDRMSLPSFEQLDADASGGVTQAEVAAYIEAQAQARFAAADANGDGALSADEMLAQADSARAERLARRIADRIEKADTNGDGLLQQSEIQAARADRDGHGGRRGASPERMFERADANEDGSLSAEEFQLALERMQERGSRRDN
ncbi:EF-hand domain-containing protein [Pseudooctadecabacter jejudonensis]|uniref:EF hand n=1 Tax=Pseudooctadecabacter jejudonensis TaxID=1391910 RepID=A0A1Y5RUX6_9RHOB|nr:calcium-binding protein [Pseudooctadecabacter jejudonensis]SLN23280.1 EF hand [Pseudooctadecabacter jejudonensis]